MTQEDKELLLRDLSARLAFHCRVFYEYVDDLDNKTYGYSLTLNTWCIDELNADKAVVKPYLRPMSSMTEEEEKEICQFMKDYNLLPGPDKAGVFCGEITDWLNVHHFDYRGLIEKGLAIAVDENNNPYKK